MKKPKRNVLTAREKRIARTAYKIGFLDRGYSAIYPNVFKIVYAECAKVAGGKK